MKFSEKVKLLRDMHGETQQEMADKVHCSREYINLLELDLREPSKTMIDMFKKAYNLTYNWLMEE